MLRRRGLPLFQFGTGNAALAPLLHIGQHSRFFLFAQQFAQHFSLYCFPSLGQHHLAFCGKFLPGAEGGQGGFCIAVQLTHSAEQPCGNQPQDIPLPGREGSKVCVCHAFRGQQCMVVGDFAAIDDLLHMDGNRLLHGKRLARGRYQSRKGCRHILRQKPAVRAGVGDEPFFVKTLGIIQGLLCRKSQQTVGIPLQCSKVIELRRAFGFFLAFHLLHRGTPLLSAFGKQQFGILFLCKPFAGCRAAAGQFQIHRVEFFWGKGGNGGFPHHRHGKHRGHNTPYRQWLTVQARKKPGRIDANHPVGTFPAECCIVQRIVFS